MHSKFPFKSHVRNGRGDIYQVGQVLHCGGGMTHLYLTDVVTGTERTIMPQDVASGVWHSVDYREVSITL